MQKLLIVTAAAVTLLSMGFQSVTAQEELFDTKGAAEQLEKGLVQLRTKHVEAAIEALEQSVAIAPDAEAYYYLGYAYYLKGRTGDGESRRLSMESFEKAYELDPAFTPNKYKPAEAVPIPPDKSKPEPQLLPPQDKARIEAKEPLASGAAGQQQKP